MFFNLQFFSLKDGDLLFKIVIKVLETTDIAYFIHQFFSNIANGAEGFYLEKTFTLL